MNINAEEIKRAYAQKTLKYLSFDISGISNNTYSEFGIQSNEKVIAHVFKKKLAFFFTEMIIITDSAIYTTKKVSKQRDTNRVAYDTLCSYVAYSEDSQLSCALLNKNDKIPVLERTLGDIFANRSYGEEITEFIQFLQLQLIAGNKELGNQREKTVEWVVEEANKAFVHGDLLNEKLYMVKELQKDPLYYKQMSLILGKNYIRDCNISEFLDYVCKIRKKENADEIIELLHHDIEQFMKDSRDSSITYYPYFMERITKSMAKSISSTEIDTENEIAKKYLEMLQYIQIAFAIRTNPFISDKDFLSKYEKMENVTSWIKFVKQLRNSLMSELVTKIKEGGYDSDDKYLNYVDANGFNPLYYALLLKNVDAANYFLKKIKKYSELPSAIVDDKYVKIFDYSFLALYLGYSDIGIELLDKEPEVLTLQKSRSALVVLLNLKKVKLSVMQKAVSNAESILSKYQRGDDVDYEKVDEAREKIAENKGNISITKEEIRDLEHDIEDLEREIQESKQRHLEKLNIWIDEMSKTDDYILKEFITVLGDYDKIKAFLNLSDEECKIFEYNGMQILVSQKIYEYYTKQANAEYEKFDQKKFKSSKKEQKEYSDAKNSEKRNYDTSWFSPEAHHNIDALRKEYRILAKKYHPDINSKYEKIFVEINTERANILESISKN